LCRFSARGHAADPSAGPLGTHDGVDAPPLCLPDLQALAAGLRVVGVLELPGEEVPIGVVGDDLTHPAIARSMSVPAPGVSTRSAP
jgi:hypothetical protein